MNEINNVKLEILRSGPAHNQLLSPLTPYIAVCGGAGPVTINMPFEHRKFLIGLRLLRYETGECEGLEPNRQAEVVSMGEAVGGIFSQIPSLLAALSSARQDRESLVHLRLALSATELSMIPFEAAIAPDAYPGSGSPLFLQPRMPISITREIRRGRPLPVLWNRPPKILFVYSTPPGHVEVPFAQHLGALREAIDPWVKLSDVPEERMESFKRILTVLPNPTLDEIREICSREAFTHVHILAHGAPYDHAGDRRFGIALSSSTHPEKADVVDGTRLAIALSYSGPTGTRKSSPTVVSLATCDSANEAQVTSPGGSIAHELHMAGVPWVFASQFPLWMSASVLFAKTLYKGLLEGDDPRWVLYQVRQHLRAALPGHHDWASIVAYATLPKDFEQQLERFRDFQMREVLNRRFERIDRGEENWDEKSLDNLARDIRSWHERWRAGNHEDSIQQAERNGMTGAYEKRLALAYDKLVLAGRRTDATRAKAVKAYEDSIKYYRKAIESKPVNHWAMTQLISMVVGLELFRARADSQPDLSGICANYEIYWNGAYHLALWDRRFGTPDTKIWACSTLLELLILHGFYQSSALRDDQVEPEIYAVAAELRSLVKEEKDNNFPVESTLRQLRRYEVYWQLPQWQKRVETAKDALTRAA